MYYKIYARHEETLSLNDVFVISKKLLKNKGRIVIVNRPENLINIIVMMRNNNIEPKRIRFVYPKKDRDAKIVLVEGVKNGKPSIKVEQPLYIHKYNGKYSTEINKMFE